MALDSATNFVRQTVGSAVGTNDPETIDVQDASAFADPSVSQYDIAIFDAGTHDGPYQDPDAEVLTVTARDTTANTLTCARGQQNTANVSHPDTSDVIVAVLAEQDVKAVNAQTVNTDVATINEGSAKIFATSGQSISNSTFTTVTFDSEDADYTPGGPLTVDLANNKITIDSTGRYIIVGNVGFASPGDGTGIRSRQKVGSDTPIEFVCPVGANSLATLPTSTVVVVTSAPKDVTLEVFQDSGGSLSTRGTEREEHLKVVKIG